MTTRPELDTTPATTAASQAKTAAVPRIKFSSKGFSIDHPDAQAGARLMADALGVADIDAMHGILRQLVKASVNGRKPDKTDLSLMLSMVKSIGPRDAIEAMLVAQMVSVHVMTMRCAYHLASAGDIASLDNFVRALGRLARTFPAQVEALNRHRNNGEPAITVQNVSVQDGGKAVVGNVTRIERVIVDPGAAVATMNAGMAGIREAGEPQPEPVDARPAARA
jgi:hypothetical protein